MSKKIIFSFGIVAFLLSIMLTSCNDCLQGNGKMAKRTAKFTEITSITLSLGADVKLVSDSTGTVTIEGEGNIINAIKLEQSGKNLNITSDGCFSSNKPITITIPMKTVNELEVKGSGSIKSDVKLLSTDLELGIYGSGDIDIQVDATNVKSEINGSGNIILKGAAPEGPAQAASIQWALG